MEIRQYVSLAPMTTFRIGGEAEFFGEPATKEELQKMLAFARERDLRVIILGGGSNILFGDGVIRGLVMSMRGLRGIEERELIWVGAGTSMEDLNQWAMTAGRSGLEWSGGLPGTVGGATYMNARAYQHEMSEVVRAVRVMDFSGREFVFEREEIHYRYKYSVFMDHEDWIILEVGLELGVSSPEEVRTRTEACQRDREQKGQYLYPSAGCAFKNDYSRSLPAGRVIDEVGLKGFRIGGAEVYQRHANFVVNTGGATAEDVIRLLETIEQRVYEQTGVRLEREVRIIR